VLLVCGFGLYTLYENFRLYNLVHVDGQLSDVSVLPLTEKGKASRRMKESIVGMSFNCNLRYSFGMR